MPYDAQTRRSSPLTFSAVLATAAALGGCAGWTIGGTSAVAPQTDAIERSTMHLTKPPHAAGECIVANAKQAGAAAQLVPLYGLESVAVTVTNRVAGDQLAVFSLVRNDTGAQAETTTWSGVAERQELLRKLTEGC